MTTPYLYASETKLLRQVKADLDRHESFREYAYPDPLSKIGRQYKGKDWPWGFISGRALLSKIKNAKEEDGAPWTYGFGFTHNVTPDSRINRITAERMLEDLILKMNSVLVNTLTWYNEASFVTKTILINMGFNMGVKGLLGFKNTLALIRAKNYPQAAQNMKLSRWYTQVGVRAEELVKRMATQSIEPQHQAN